MTTCSSCRGTDQPVPATSLGTMKLIEGPFVLGMVADQPWIWCIACFRKEV